MTRERDPHERIGPPPIPESLWDLQDPVPAALRLYGGSYQRWRQRFGVEDQKRSTTDLGDVMEDIMGLGPEGSPPLLVLQYRMWWLTFASPVMLAEGGIDWPESGEHKTARALVNLRRIYPNLPWVRYDWRPTREEATDTLSVVLASRPLSAKRFWCWQIAGWTAKQCRDLCERGGEDGWQPSSDAEIARFRDMVNGYRAQHPKPPPPVLPEPCIKGWKSQPRDYADSP